MSGRIAGLMVSFGLAWTGVALAQAPEMPERPRFVFPTRPEVIIKMVQPSTSSSIRGKLLSLTDREVVIDTGKKSPARDRGRSDSGSSISFERIESLRTLDGDFEFTPKEDFQSVSERIVVAFASVTIEDASLPAGSPQNTTTPYITPSTTLPGSDPNEDPAKVGHAGTQLAPRVPRNKPPVAKPPVKGLGQSGFGGIKSLTKPKKTDPASAEMPAEGTGTEAATPAATTPPATAGATEVFLCSNCGKEIPASAVKTGVCPYCKIAFSNVTGPPSQMAQNPFQRPAGAGNNPFAQPGVGPSVSPSAPPTNTGSQVVENSGFSIDSIPNWAKGGMFLLLVLVGWHVMNR